MPKAKAKPASGPLPLPQLPPAEESAAAVREATKRLGLLARLLLRLTRHEFENQ